MGQPLDNQKGFFYGQFVKAAYTMFDNPGSDPLRPEPAGIPDGWELGAWIHMSDFFLDLAKVKFYGIVVHEIANPDSRIIAIRGTEGAVEWLDDAFALLVAFRQAPSAGRVAWGFDRIYSSMKVIRRPLPKPPGAPVAEVAPGVETFGGSFGDQLDQLAGIREAERGSKAPFAEGRARPKRPTVVTGHSLGAALATLFVMENDTKRKFDLTALCTFASPRVGNTEFAHAFDKLPIDSWRIVNTCDAVPKLPPHVPIILDYDHVDVAYSFDSSKFAKNNLVCCHKMETYLHWLNSASPLSSDCVP